MTDISLSGPSEKPYAFCTCSDNVALGQVSSEYPLHVIGLESVFNDCAERFLLCSSCMSTS